VTLPSPTQSLKVTEGSLLECRMSRLPLI